MTGSIGKKMGILKERLLFLGSAVENNLLQAVKAVRDNDFGLAREVRINDTEIDEFEVNVEDDCMAILALQQPVAGDLRFIVTALKINIDLERIGDLAVKVAEKANYLHNRQSPAAPVLLAGAIRTELDAMITDTVWMLKSALDAFAREDRDLALQVIRADEKVDAAKNLIRSLLEDNYGRDPHEHLSLATILSISRSLERIADHATNICEDVIYMLSGDIIRHRSSV